MSIKKQEKRLANQEGMPLTRRHFVQASAALVSMPFFAQNAQANLDKSLPIANIDEKPATVVATCSTFDCGGKCDIRAHVKEGIVTRITTRPDADLDEQMPIMRACVRGRGYRKFTYHADRLKYPMKRVGKRGEGKFERISWDEATSLIAENVTRLTQQHGAASRFLTVNTAVTGGIFSGDTMMKKLFNLTGGYLPYYHSVSLGNTAKVTPYTYGVSKTGSSLDTLADTPLVILWGHNPNETIFGHTNHYFQKMKNNGTKFIVVDPRYSDTAQSLADQWIPLLPTTDNALMDAMMYVIVTENLHDKAFIDKYVVGFDEDHMPEGVPANESLMAYLLGKKDGIAKTPEWATKITRVPANTIRQLAREYAMTKPAALIQGWGPQRHICGERTARGSTLLAAITGNVGKKGAWAAGYGGIGNRQSIPALSHYVPAIEGPEDKLTEKYPLQMLTWKGKNRANSTQYANPWLQEVQRQEMWINPIDAQNRGIKNGDMVRIYNDRGITQIPALVTERIIPGVVGLQAGAWWSPDKDGVDHGGCPNVLTSTRMTPLAHGNSHLTVLVEVTKA
ncbi:molybdopterin-dependent oxidoreductase [Proteus mirabilis]|nr:molybdopterin-dependent oxidoreductase [Proteus mirabilis]